MISTILFSRPFTHFSASVILPLIPSGILFTSVYLFFSSSRSLINILHLLHCFPKIIVYLHYHYSVFFSWKLPLSTSFSCFSRDLSCSFMWDITAFSSWLAFCNVDFVLATMGLWFFLLLLSALWWRRLRLVQGCGWVGLCSLPVSCVAWGDTVLGCAGSMAEVAAT